MSNLIASGLLDHGAHYLTWGWLSVSIPNLVIILIMVVVFVLAIALPFPKGDKDEVDEP